MRKLIGAATVALLMTSALVAFGASPASAVTGCAFPDPQLQYPCAAFVNGLGGHVFDSGEAAFWAGVGQSDGRLAEASGLLYSTEFLSRVVGSLYQGVLGRAPEPSGMLFWTSGLIDHSISYEQLVGFFASSDEGFANLGGTNADFINGLYNLFLDRDADAGGIDYWSGQIAAMGRYPVSQAIIHSSEALSTFTAAQFEAVLDRTPEPASLAFWSAYDGEHGILAVIAQLLASDEAFALYSQNPAPATTGGAVAAALAG